MFKRSIIIIDEIQNLDALKSAAQKSVDFQLLLATHDVMAARNCIVDHKPNLILINPYLPGLNGFDFIKRVMNYAPTSVVALYSSAVVTEAMSTQTIAAGAIGAVARSDFKSGRLFDDIFKGIKNVLHSAERPSQAPVSVPSHGGSGHPNQAFPLIAIASSTGGTEALKELLPHLPLGLPPILIVQHMLPSFTRAFAENLSKISAFTVKHATDGERIDANTAYLCPGNFHMEVKRTGSLLHIKLQSEPPMHNVRPAADYLFHSIAKLSAAASIGVVLTGMGRDGADGLLAMKKSGSYNIAQDERSCVVFGMPKAAIDKGAIQSILSLHDIAGAIVARSRRIRGD
ncbi:MAG: response regulator [Proteobacteria bacterium]|nr:MAG: response regulator [Pseudomonadota bacterium]